jgi:uncharacterized membrane protein
VFDLFTFFWMNFDGMFHVKHYCATHYGLILFTVCRMLVSIIYFTTHLVFSNMVVQIVFFYLVRCCCMCPYVL